MVSIISIFTTLMWKNVIVRKRHWFLTLLEIAAPCFIFALAFYIHKKTVLNMPEHISESLDLELCSIIDVGYAPNNKFTKGIMNKIKERKLSFVRDVVPFVSEAEIENYYAKLDANQREMFYGVIFDQSSSKFKYKIRIGDRFDESIMDLTFPKRMPLGNGALGYIYILSCFVSLQKQLDEVYIESVTKKDLRYKISLWSFPYPPTTYTLIQENIDVFLSFCIVLCFCIILPNIIKRVVEEKASGVKELMKMTGIQPWMIWFGWLLNANMINIFITIIITVILTTSLGTNVEPIIVYINPLIVWSFLFLFMSAATVYLFVICAIIHKPLIALTVGMMFYLVPFFVMDSSIFTTPFPMWLKLIVCLIPTINIREGTQVIVVFSSHSKELNWSNLFSKAIDDVNELSMGTVFVMFIVEILLYAFLTWYIDNVRPGPFGIAKPFNFIFICFKSKNEVVIVDNRDNSKYYEAAPAQLRVGLSVRKLTKVFAPNVLAVNGVNIDIYKGEITALLGHNGAGKTTTMSILTGLFSPTSGTVHHHDSDRQPYNVFDNMNRFRQDLGLCPQHNMLFSYFTVIEHLIFFGMLKGLSYFAARKDGRRLLRQLNMFHKSNVNVNKLSGGMKRKVSLAISLTAEPKILMLDEPTSGMDPESRREMWDILLSLREGRSIVITTHFMEEADVLGDRIAIMDHGQVRCYGTSIFLKKVYGAGYNLTLLTKPRAIREDITKCIRQHITGSTLRTYHQGQLVYNLPTETSSKFANLFSDLESKKDELAITSIGVSCTTMEDVFLKVGELSISGKVAEKDISSRKSIDSTRTLSIDSGGPSTSRKSKDSSRTSRTSDQSSYRSTENDYPEKISGFKLIIQQFCILFKMKIKYTYRKCWSFLFYLVLSTLMFGMVLYSDPSSKTGVPLLLKLDPNLFSGSFVISTFTDQQEVVENVNMYGRIVLKNFDVQFVKNGILTEKLLNVANDNLQQYRLKYVFSADWGKDTVNAFYSNIPYHAPPISLNLVTNTLLKVLSNDESQSIEVTNHPFAGQAWDPCAIGNDNVMTIRYVMLALVVPFGTLFVIANLISFPLTERVSCSKHLQMMTGLSPITYWLSFFLWDLIIFMTMALMFLIPIIFLDSENLFSSWTDVVIFMLIIISYGVSAIMFAYFVSFLRRSSAGATAAFIFYNILFGVSAMLTMLILKGFNILTGNWYTFVDGLFLLNPYYCVSMALFHFCFLLYNSSICEKCSHVPHIISWYNCTEIKALAFPSDSNPDAVGGYILYLLMLWLLYFVLIVLLDYGLLGKVSKYVKKLYQREGNQGNLDNDVIEERNRVNSQGSARMNQNELYPVLLVDRLLKIFGLRFCAVKGISFTVSSGECFGLLGVNGAGKTTTFKMLTGEIVPTAGNAKIGKYNLTNNRSKYLKQIGYCPQFDAITEIFTGEEILFMYGLIKGLSTDDSKFQTNYWIHLLGLEEYRMRRCGTYSGGNKRKLNTAIALIGDPQIVFLDEPTSGVDPVARRKLWTVLTGSQKAGQSIVLTSHSMDECEALCDRLTIMVKGQMVCIGSIQYLKQKFGKGYTVMVKFLSQELGSNSVIRLKEEIEHIFAPFCHLKDEHIGLLHYHINDTTKTWSQLFRSMDEIKKKHQIVEDYVISETTLEQVFISFAKQQKQQST